MLPSGKDARAPFTRPTTFLRGACGCVCVYSGVEGAAAAVRVMRGFILTVARLLLLLLLVDAYCEF